MTKLEKFEELCEVVKDNRETLDSIWGDIVECNDTLSNELYFKIDELEYQVKDINNKLDKILLIIGGEK